MRLVRLKTEEIPKGARQPLDRTALPVGVKLYCSLKQMASEQTWKVGTIYRYGKLTPPLAVSVEDVPPIREHDEVATARITAWLGDIHEAGIWHEEHDRLKAKPCTYREGDVIRMGIGGVRLRVESVVLADAKAGTTGCVHIRQAGPVSERWLEFTPRPKHVDDEQTISAGTSELVAGVRVEVTTTKIMEPRAGDASTVHLKAWADAEGRWFPQEYAKVKIGQAFVVYRNYCCYRVQAIVPSMPEHNLVGWVELVPMSNPLDLVDKLPRDASQPGGTRASGP
jgi:hypothetical protein